jgi:hypothetical protein
MQMQEHDGSISVAFKRSSKDHPKDHQKIIQKIIKLNDQSPHNGQRTLLHSLASQRFERESSVEAHRSASAFQAWSV